MFEIIYATTEILFCKLIQSLEAVETSTKISQY